MSNQIFSLLYPVPSCYGEKKTKKKCNTYMKSKQTENKL